MELEKKLFKVNEVFNIFYLSDHLLSNEDVIKLSKQVNLADNDLICLSHDYWTMYIGVKAEECFAYAELKWVFELKQSLEYVMSLFSKSAINFDNANYEKILFHQMHCYFLDEEFDNSLELIQLLRKQFPENSIYINWEIEIKKKKRKMITIIKNLFR